MLRLRRLIAFALLVGYAASAAEAVAGVVRDGAVHHESSAAAAAHNDAHRGDHGHEDSGSQPEHGPKHQHGTAGDHCTHAHGASLPAVCELAVPAQIAGFSAPLPPLDLSGSFRSPTFRPPRA